LTDQHLLDELLADPPRFFRDKQGEPTCWWVGEPTIRYLVERLDSDCITLETGAGVSTVIFALIGTHHTAIVPSAEIVDRIREWCSDKHLSLDRTEFIIGRSEEILPRFESSPLDLVLIDGCHGFPAPFIDWYYASLKLKLGGDLLVDDNQLWTGYLLCEFLRAEPEWKFVLELGKTTVFRKRAHVGYVKEWIDQPFVAERGSQFGRRRTWHSLNYHLRTQFGRRRTWHVLNHHLRRGFSSFLALPRRLRRPDEDDERS
jgi:hypothetical protein